MNDYSPKYKRAIAHLAQKIHDSHMLDGCSLDINDSSGMLWDEAVKQRPGLKVIAKDVEGQLNYELSFNQCCNAIMWNYRFTPEDWVSNL